MGAILLFNVSTISFEGTGPQENYEIIYVKKDAFLTVGVTVQGLNTLNLGEKASVLADNVEISGTNNVVFGTNAKWYGKAYVLE